MQAAVAIAPLFVSHVVLYILAVYCDCTVHWKGFLFFVVAGVLEEAEFYNVKELIYLCKERIADRERDQDKVKYCTILLSIRASVDMRCLLN